MSSCGRWILEELDIYNPYSGITTNSAESINNVIKSIQKRKELPVDLIVISLFFLQKSDYTELLCGRAGFGNYKLRKEVRHFASIELDNMPLSDITGTVDDILLKAKNRLDIVKGQLRHPSFLSFVDKSSGNSGDSEEIENDNPISCKSPELTEDSSSTKPLHDTINNVLKDKNATLVDDKSLSERKGQEKNLTQKMLADQLVHENKIQWVPSMNVYLVEGIKQSKRVVTLVPKETCSCPSTSQCYHILAVKTAYNINTTNEYIPVKKNLSMLIKDTKLRVAKKRSEKN